MVEMQILHDRRDAGGRAMQEQLPRSNISVLHLLPASPFSSLTGSRLLLLRHCTHWREIQVYHVPHDSQINRLRAPLYTDQVYGCIGLLSRLANLPGYAILALGPNGGSSPAFITIRNSETSLTLPIPAVLRNLTLCHSMLNLLPSS